MADGAHVDGVLVLQRPAQMVELGGVLAGLLLVGGVDGLGRRGRVWPGPGGGGGALRLGQAALHQEGDGGGGAGKQRYCLIMPGLCHVYTIDLDRQQISTSPSPAAQRKRNRAPNRTTAIALGSPLVCSTYFMCIFRQFFALCISKDMQLLG